MADPRKLSIEEMLAAARAEKGGASSSEKGPAAKAPSPREESASESEPVAADASAKSAAKPAAAKSAAAKPAAVAKPGSMSVAEMMAAARAEKAGGAKPAAASLAESKPAAEPKATAKPAAKEGAVKPAAKPAAEKVAPEKGAGPKDTASVLTAARAGAKPGPMTKAEAAAKGQSPITEKSAEKRKAAVPPMPEKPAYARPAAAVPAGDEPDRRSFLGSMMGAIIGTPLAIGFTSLAVTHLLWVLGFARFMFPNILTEPPTRFRVGFPDEYAPGQVQEKYKAQFGVWIVRHEYEGQSEIYALKSVCTHLGCTPNWLEGEQKFKCPCHGSGFYKDGINFEGPAPRPLERYAISKAADGQIEVDKSRTFFEEKGEWKDTASFVEV